MRYETLTEEQLPDMVSTNAAEAVRIWNEMAELIDTLEKAALNRQLAGEALAELTTNLLRQKFGRSRESMSGGTSIPAEDPLNDDTDGTEEAGSKTSSDVCENAGTPPQENAGTSGEADGPVSRTSKKPREEKKPRGNCAKKRGFEEMFAPLEKVIRYYNLENPDAPVCPKCGGKMTLKEWKLIRRYIEILPVEVHVVEERAARYECPECDKDEDNTYLTADTPAAVIEGSNTCPATLATLLESKNRLGIPAARYAEFLSSMGCGLSRSTLVSQYNRAGAELLAPVIGELAKDLKAQEIGFCDETVLQVLHEEDLEGNPRRPEQKGYVWVFTGLTPEGLPITCYRYAPTRGSIIPDTFLKDASWKYIHTDGYSGYSHLSMTRLICLAHARRKFYEAVPPAGSGTVKKVLLVQDILVMKFDQIFELERLAAGRAPQEIQEIRRSQELPILEDIFSLARSLKPAKGGKLEKACTYVRGHEEELKNYMKDARLESTNNRSERSVKTLVLDRRNFLFCNSEKGALAFCNALSLQTTAEAFGLNPWLYLYTVLTFIPAWKEDPEKVRMLLPYSPFMQEHCRGAVTRDRILMIKKMAEPELISITRERKERKRLERNRKELGQVLENYTETAGIRPSAVRNSRSVRKQPSCRTSGPRPGAPLHTGYDPLGYIRYREVPEYYRDMVASMQEHRTRYLQFIQELGPS